jgi:hypothetical protein
MSNSSEAESAVRNYLVALSDPESLRDESRIAELQKQVEETSDALERLKVRAALMQAQNVDIGQFEAAFVTHAAAWAAEIGVEASAFMEEGVPRKVLRDAGLLGGGGGKARPRRSRVTADDIREAYPSSKRARFTLRELVEATGASIATVRKVVTDDVANGTLAEAGTARDHSRRGRAPALFKRA